MINAKVSFFYAPTGTLNWIDPDTWSSYIGDGVSDGKWAHRFFTQIGVAAAMPGAGTLADATQQFIGYFNSGNVLGPYDTSTIQIDLTFNSPFKEMDFDFLMDTVTTAASYDYVETTLDAFDSAGDMRFVKAYAHQESNETP